VCHKSNFGQASAVLEQSNNTSLVTTGRFATERNEVMDRAVYVSIAQLTVFSGAEHG
jgi:hypothetical protein